MKFQFGKDDLVNNPTPRVPVCLCVDVSSSMNAVEGGNYKMTGKTIFRDGITWNVVQGGTSRMQKLREGINLFFNEIKNDDIALYSAEIAMVSFSDTADIVSDFSSIGNQAMPELKTGNNTCMGEGVNLALDLLDKRKDEYKVNGVDYYYQPWLIIMSDGYPNGSYSVLDNAISRTCSYVNSNKLTVIPVGIGDGADLNTLSKFSPNNKALSIESVEFKQFFAWLSKSVSKVSQSVVGGEYVFEMESFDNFKKNNPIK